MCRILHVLALDYHCRPSDLVAGGNAALSFDAIVHMKGASDVPA